MIDVKDVSKVKKNVEKFIGSKVKLESSRGREKTAIKIGVIEKAYPSIFTIQLYDGKEMSGKVSYSYTDILTRTVSLTLCE